MADYAKGILGLHPLLAAPRGIAGLLGQGYDAALANPAVDDWRMGVGQRLSNLLTDPGGFYKSALMDAVPTPGEMGRLFQDPFGASQEDRDKAMGFGMLGIIGQAPKGGR